MIWGRLLAMLLLLGPGVAMACSPRMPWPWKKRSPDGRHELAQVLSRQSRNPGATMSLRDLRTGRLLWTRNLEGTYGPEDVVLASGRPQVLLLGRTPAALTLLDARGWELGIWPLDKLLTPSELRRLSLARCDSEGWAREARSEEDGFSVTLPVRAPVGGGGESRHIVVKLPWVGLFQREPTALAQESAELRRLFRTHTEEAERLRIADELWGLSSGGPTKGNLELRSFWLVMLQDSPSPRALLPIAVDALGASGSQEELRGLIRLPWGAPERDAQILQVLKRRLPDLAGDYALRVLEEGHPAAPVRALAAGELLSRGGAAAEFGKTFIARDASLRADGALARFTAQAELAQELWQALPFCGSSRALLRAQATRSLEALLRDAKEQRPFVQELLRPVSSAPDTALVGCSEVLLMLGALADQTGDAPEALRLYTAGLEALAAETSAARLEAAQGPRLEATLRVAALLKEAREWRKMEALLQELLADPARRNPVCIPKPRVYDFSQTPGACGKKQPAETVARQLLRESKAENLEGRNSEGKR
ncbi:hypothetical protein [Hyalangium rubrum]|uniref:Uncharacterized protein n=1 Tax=Hyalangium rubrum TaxID=3103134 RepID=A0ABU5GZI4_9BACT|nr:hypothetical protein [Hyalangium sp. s54d21]MDY7226594.1 hypothetical protein [Hyalangium sp. s54d21]